MSPKPGLTAEVGEEIPSVDETAQEAGARESGSFPGVHHSTQPTVFESGVVPARDSLVVPATGIYDLHQAITAQHSNENEFEQPAKDEVHLVLLDPSVILHEVRNHATPIMHAVSMLEKIAYVPQTEARNSDIRTLLEVIKDSTEQILGVVKNLPGSEPSELPPADPAWNPNFQKIHLGETIPHLITGWKFMAQNAGISFRDEIADNISIQGDPVKLNEILSNLIKNAIEVLEGSEAPEIIFTLRVHPNVPELVQIIVQDNGHGIPEENLDRIFKDHFTMKKERGHGIGLGLSKKLAKEMGGDVVLVNNRDRHDLENHEHIQGACAVLELPRAA